MERTYRIVDAFCVEGARKDKMVVAFDRRMDFADYDKKEVVIDGKPTTYELTHNENWIIIQKTDSDLLGKTATFT